MSDEPTRAEICAAACADTWRGAGEVLASPIGLIPSLGARLARLTTAPELLLTDGEALLVADPPPLGREDGAAAEGWMPYRQVLDLLAGGRRQVMMGATQLDRHGNQNISRIGAWDRPKVQLIGVRGAPGNTANHTTNYWVPRHGPRVFVESVDLVSGVGHDRPGGPFHDVRVVVSDLGVFDFSGPGGTMALRSVHPGVAPEQVQEATGFELDVSAAVPTRLPSAAELELIRTVLDPDGLRYREVPR